MQSKPTSLSCVTAIRCLAVSRRRGFVALLVVAAGLSSRSTSAANILYVSNSGRGSGATIGEYTTDGAVINTALVSTGLGWPNDIIANNGLLYVVDNGDTKKSIQTFTTAGVPVKTPLISGLADPVSLAFDGHGNLFVSLTFGIGEYTLTGGAVSPSLISATHPVVEGVACDGNGHLFLSETFGLISEYTTGGVPINTKLITGLNYPTYLALDGGGHLFVVNTDAGTIGEYTTSGGVVNASLISGLNSPVGIALDGQGHIFVANNLSGTIGEYTTTGQVVNASLITGLNYPTGVAIQIVPEPSAGVLAVLGLGAVLFVIRQCKTEGRTSRS